MAWPAIAGAVLGAASSILPKVLSKKKKINPIWQRVNWAKQAGIHPLYALGAGMGSDYGGFAGSPMSWGDAVGGGLDALGGALNVWDQENQQGELDRQRAKERAEDRMFQREMRQPPPLSAVDKAQIELLQAQTRSINAESAARALGATRGGHNSMPTFVTTPWGEKVAVPPGASVAQDWQNVWGEGGEWLGSILNFLERYGGAPAKGFDFGGSPKLPKVPGRGGPYVP